MLLTNLFFFLRISRQFNEFIYYIIVYIVLETFAHCKQFYDGRIHSKLDDFYIYKLCSFTYE